jgi:hypothetical protein
LINGRELFDICQRIVDEWQGIGEKRLQIVDKWQCNVDKWAMNC